MIDGLNPNVIAGYRRMPEQKISDTINRISDHYVKHSGYLAYSGGKDSTALLLLAAETGHSIPVVFFDSGLEFPETRPYIEETVTKLGLSLTVIEASPDALTIMEMTGAWDHDAPLNFEVPDMHETLITKPAGEAHARYGVGELNGMRMNESFGRRMLLSKNSGSYVRAGEDVVLAPLWNWREQEVTTFLAKRGQTLNPVYAKLEKLGVPAEHRRVGLAFDGNGLENGRVTWLKRGWNPLYIEIARRLPRVREWD